MAKWRTETTDRWRHRLRSVSVSDIGPRRLHTHDRAFGVLEDQGKGWVSRQHHLSRVFAARTGYEAYREHDGGSTEWRRRGILVRATKPWNLRNSCVSGSCLIRFGDSSILIQ